MQRFPHAISKTGGADKFRRVPSDLRIIKPHGVGLVPRHGADPFRVQLTQHIRRDMDNAGLHAQRLRRDAHDLIPRHPLVGGNVVGVANGVRIAHQAAEALGKVIAVGQRPQRGAVAGHDDFFALTNPLHHLKGTEIAMQRHRHLAFAVGMAGAHHGEGEAVFPILPHQPVFAGGLIAAILPIRVAQRSRLRDQRIHRRLLIRRRGRNENILIGSPAEKANVPLQLFHVKNDEVRHDVKMEITQQLAHLFFVVHIHTKGFSPRRQRMISPVQQIKLPAFFQAALADRIGDRSRAANKQRFSHEGFLLSISSPKGKKC